MRRDLAVAGAFALVWAAAVRAQDDPLERWRRNHWGLEATTTVRQCQACHVSGEPGAHAGHPVDVDYAAAVAAPRSSLRPLAEAVRRGVLLVDGKVHCYTCHDPRSPWQDHVAIPPGAAPRMAVVIGLELTYARDRPAPVDGGEVSPTPLCRACHAYGD